MPGLLKLSAHDNIGVATKNLAVGTNVMLDGKTIRMLDAVAVGHKAAIHAIAVGEKVYKFGCPIGSATVDITAGQHVHTHNLKSDYLPTFTLEAGKKFVKG